MNREPTVEAVSALGLKLWREREIRFPPRTRRMMPDDLDRISGAWAHICARAYEMLKSPGTDTTRRAKAAGIEVVKVEGK